MVRPVQGSGKPSLPGPGSVAGKLKLDWGAVAGTIFSTSWIDNVALTVDDMQPEGLRYGVGDGAGVDARVRQAGLRDRHVRRRPAQPVAVHLRPDAKEDDSFMIIMIRGVDIDKSLVQFEKVVNLT